MRKIAPDRIVTEPKDVWEKYICPQCRCLLEEAVQSACGHRLCKRCAEELFLSLPSGGYPTCPVKDDGEEHLMKPDDEDIEEPDGSDPPQNNYCFPDKFAQRDIAKLVVRCEFSGCKEEMTVVKMKEHVKACSHASAPCEYCHEDIPLVKVEEHKNVCPSRKLFCPFSGLELGEPDNPMTQMKKRWNDAIQCCNSHGFSKKDFDDHLESCQEHHWILTTSAINLLQSDIKLLQSMQRSQNAVADSDYVEKDGKVKNRLHLAKNLSQDEVESDAGKDVYKKLYEEQKKDVVRLDKMLEYSNGEVSRAKGDLGNLQSQVKDLTEKLEFFEKKLSTREQQLEEKDFRLSLLESSSFGGEMIWRISGFEARTKDARDARYTSIFSLPFYTSKYGYKMCLRLYPLGDGMGKNTHLSLFFVVMKSEYDSLLQWPFTNKVALTLINQNGGDNVTDTFKPDPKSSSFQRPKTEMNVASGCPRFVQLDDLHRNGFIKDDTIFIKVKVESLTTQY